MFGMGTLVNTLAVLAGGVCGLVVKKRLNENIEKTMIVATGIGILFLSITSVIKDSFVIEQGQLVLHGGLMSIVSLCVGGLLGEIFHIQDGFEHFGKWLKKVAHQEKDMQFLDAFMHTTLTICIGAMAIVGSIQDGLYGDPKILFAKAFLDFVIVMMYSATLGKGCLFASVPLLILQGSLTILAYVLAAFFTTSMLNNISIVGNMLIFCVGINLLFPGKIRVANVLPALLVAILFAII